MSLTVRLQGLSLLTSFSEIQNFFSGLKIQDGGVKLLCDQPGTALVTFTSFLEACYALNRSGQLLRNVPVKVTLEDELRPTPSQSWPIPERFGYLRISFQPLNATLSDVKLFFKDLAVKSVLFLTTNKARNGHALVKFNKLSDTFKALTLTLTEKNGFSVLSAKLSHEKEWAQFGSKGNPPQRQSLYVAPSRRAHLVNISRSAGKRHIMHFLHGVKDAHITFVYDKSGCRTRDCFITCKTEDIYVKVLARDKAVLNGRPVRVLPVTKEQMSHFIKSRRLKTSKDMESEEQTVSPAYSPKTRCLHVRNFPTDVNQLDILDFFGKFTLNKDDVHILYDDNRDGLGEAIVKFSTENEASKAKKLHRKAFRGTEVEVRSITRAQLKVLGVPGFDLSSIDDSKDNGGHFASVDDEDHVSSVTSEEMCTAEDDEHVSSMDHEDACLSMDDVSSVTSEETCSSVDDELVSSVKGEMCAAVDEKHVSSMNGEETCASVDNEHVSSVNRKETCASVDGGKRVSSMNCKETCASVDYSENMVFVSVEDDSPDLSD